jgi:hypothetical protein
VVAPHTSAFGGEADNTVAAILIGLKRLVSKSGWFLPAHLVFGPDFVGAFFESRTLDCGRIHLPDC